MSSSVVIRFSSDASIDLFSELATLEVADALQPLAGDMSVEAPELGFFVGDLLAMSRFAASELADAVDFVLVERYRQVTPRMGLGGGVCGRGVIGRFEGGPYTPDAYVVEVEAIGSASSERRDVEVRRCDIGEYAIESFHREIPFSLVGYERSKIMQTSCRPGMKDER
jgi:hypothetical protein